MHTDTVQDTTNVFEQITEPLVDTILLIFRYLRSLKTSIFNKELTDLKQSTSNNNLKLPALKIGT
eukprot:3666113-Amphidinium_carterae.1